MGQVVAVKPNVAMWPALLLVSGMWLPALACGATTIALSVLPLVRYGPPVYASWAHAIGAAAPRVAYNASLPALFARLDIPEVGTLAAVALIAAAALWVWRRRPAAADTSAVALVLALAASPIAWIMYFVFLFPVFASRRWTSRVWAAAVLQLVPYWCLWLPATRFGFWTPLAGWLTSGVLLLLLAEIALAGFPRSSGLLVRISSRRSSAIMDARAALQP